MACKSYQKIFQDLLVNPEKELPTEWQSHAESCLSCQESIDEIRQSQKTDLFIKANFAAYKSKLEKEYQIPDSLRAKSKSSSPGLIRVLLDLIWPTSTSHLQRIAVPIFATLLFAIVFFISRENKKDTPSEVALVKKEQPSKAIGEFSIEQQESDQRTRRSSKSKTGRPVASPGAGPTPTATQTIESPKPSAKASVPVINKSTANKKAPPVESEGVNGMSEPKRKTLENEATELWKKLKKDFSNIKNRKRLRKILKLLKNKEGLKKLDELEKSARDAQRSPAKRPKNELIQ